MLSTVSFLFDVVGGIWNSTVSVPDNCPFTFTLRVERVTLFLLNDLHDKLSPLYTEEWRKVNNLRFMTTNVSWMFTVVVQIIYSGR